VRLVLPPVSLVYYRLEEKVEDVALKVEGDEEEDLELEEVAVGVKGVEKVALRAEVGSGLTG
jgi:hypothetical protein